jgi:hypothetical protein
MIKINYGINKKVKRKIIHKNHHLCLKKFDFNNYDDRKAIIKKIHLKHPGWCITGYCEAVK